MEKIAIVTDSTADMSNRMAAEHDITVAPLSVNFGDQSFLDGIEISAEEFYKKLQDSDALPTTSQVSVGAFVEIYKDLAEQVDTIISIHISEKLSGTYQAAVLAAQEFSDVEIVPVNSKSVTTSLAFQVRLAAEEIRRGSGKEEILKRLERAQEQQKIYFSVRTLEYLEKGGRIGKAQALLGTLLNIKPVLTVDDEGYVAPFEKIRGYKRVIKRLAELYGEFIEKHGPNCFQAIMHAAAEDEARNLKAIIEEKYGPQNLEINQLGPVVGTHTGPGAMGLILTPR